MRANAMQGSMQAQQSQPESSFPPMQPADAVRYQSMFQQMDNDRDGYVQASCTNADSSAILWFLTHALLRRGFKLGHPI